MTTDTNARGAATLPPGRIEREFTALYRTEHAAQVRRAALITGSDEVGHDVVHDAFVELLRRWGSIVEHGPYLNRAVLNRCRDVLRTRRTRAAIEPRLAAGHQPAVDEALFDVLARLPFHQRAAVVLRFYDRMTEREIADALGCKAGSVGPWIHRALTTMRKELS